MTVKELIEKLQELPPDYQIKPQTKNALLKFYEIDVNFEYMKVLFKFNFS
jgi:hypothetical protein